MSSNTAESTSNRPQRLVRAPTNPMASRAPAARVSEPASSASPGPSGASPIESIAVDLQGAPAWKLAVIALGVGVVCVIGLLVAS